jgi:hypothetical protein
LIANPLKNRFTNRKNNPEKGNHIGAQKTRGIAEFEGRLKAFTA